VNCGEYKTHSRLSTDKARYEPLSAAVGRGIFELASMSGVRGFDPQGNRIKI
jgi:hypothetical protein